MIPYFTVTLRFTAHDGRYARLYRTISPVCNAPSDAQILTRQRP